MKKLSLILPATILITGCGNSGKNNSEALNKNISENKISMRFIAIKKSEGAYGIGLDACDICGPSGYFERNGDVICKLCDVVMNKATIGFPGGCNPVPLPYILHDGKIKIKVEDLEKESYRFK